jgi:hypothetical protein
MDTDTPTGNAVPAVNVTRKISLTNHVEDEHQFCPKCGMCLDCKDCAIWGCGTITEDDE